MSAEQSRFSAFMLGSKEIRLSLLVVKSADGVVDDLASAVSSTLLGIIEGHPKRKMQSSKMKLYTIF